MRPILATAFLSSILFACSSGGGGRPLARSCAIATGVIEGPSWTSETVAYRCRPGTELQVAYLHLNSGESFAALYYDGRLSLLQERELTTGPAYVALDEQNSVRWRLREGRGVLSFLAADHTATEETLLWDCEPEPAIP